MNEIKSDQNFINNIENIDLNVTHSTATTNTTLSTPDGNHVNNQMLEGTDDLYTKKYKHTSTKLCLVFSMNELKTFIEMFFHLSTSLDHAIEVEDYESSNNNEDMFKTKSSHTTKHSQENVIMIPILISIEGIYIYCKYILLYIHNII